MTPIHQQLLDAIADAPETVLEPTLLFLQSQLRNSASLRPASGQSILRHAGKWQGNDFEECLQAVYDSRSEAKF